MRAGMFDSIKESMSQLRIRWRYRASSVLFVAGIIYSVFGGGLLIPSFLAPPLSLLILIPAIFLLCMGLGLWKYRTEATRIALLWWEVPAVILFASGILLACLGCTIKDDLLIMVYLLVVLVIFAGPGIFVITHGRSLFGPTALRHRQLKELYQKAVINRVADPQIPTSEVVAEKDKQLLPVWIKFGGILFSIAFAGIEGMMLLDTYDRPVSGKAENYNYATDNYNGDYGYDDGERLRTRQTGAYATDNYNGGYGYDAGERLRTRQTGATPEQTKAVLDLFDRYGDIGQTEEQIWEKRRTAQRLGSDIGNFVADALDKGDGRISPENKQRIAQEAGEMFEQFGRVMMGGPEGMERTQQIQESYREYERQVEQQRQAEQMAVELLNIFGN